ncbi:V-type proton ATPase 116 kDa subunit a 1-like isoform X2 [Hydractinia symbiolongicarpus]|uniref:V-type proton ATPase 116 kDa subunit a 1-like isoform X2 n=1 Tax=Hydractinia symbiolongicarpus TaxID=13093 RepID=UPI00254BD6F4|nr:V-type proton ATPase 116 kDa subunit a 1-like isoform X2 [Hydractinia symbiolongicarpus]
MTSMFRSEEMTLCQLFLQSESAYACVSELGELGVVEFRDLNPDVNAFQRKFVNEVRRCDEMERKLRFMQKEIDKAEIPIVDNMENPEAPHPREMIDLEAQFEQLENEMKDSNSNYEALQRSFLELTELKHILKKTQTFFEEEGYAETQARLAEHEPSAAGGQLGFVAGVILRERIPSFERLLWRACRGNVFFKYAEIETQLHDPVTGDPTNKCVFIVFFQGEQLKIRVKKICEGFRATLYPCPETPAERREMAIGVMTRIEDLQSVINQTQEHRHRLLQTIAKNISVWFIKVRKIKAIYHTMNMFNLDVTQKCLIAECWAPVADLDTIQSSLRRGTESSGASVPSILNRMTTKQSPPTFNRTNKFTHGFQAIVDAYGVADYQEVNPALYTIITFPFLFSVMFGDFGHGTIMMFFAAWLIWNEKKFAIWKGGGEMFDTVFHGRYIIFLMGIFSIYSGFLYNDIFSKSMNIFGSGWVELNSNKSDYDISKLHHYPESATIMFNPNDTARATPYYFGVDPIWQLATNKLTFTNSLKMKLSIVFGVTHMMFGVVLSLFNHIHFKQRINIWCEFIPQLLFIGCIFGYLVILIFYKWVAYSIKDENAPSLLLGLIGMFLDFGKEIKEEELVYAGQKNVQTFLVLVAVLSVPWMLLVKPFYLRHQNKQKVQKRPGFSRFVDDGINGDPEGINHSEIVHNEDTVLHREEEEEEVFDFGEVFIHQAIHTIEYCLGCISNTASYLRLWALSLAHAQLSEVLWSMVFHIALKMSGVVGAVAVFVIFSAWAVLTVAILLVMEGLSAFLHTLRLHWVEFNSKFYHGAGNKFQPFSFKVILADDL